MEFDRVTFGPLPCLTEALIRQQTSSDSYQQGCDLYRRGSVLSVSRRGRQLQAEVEGSQYEPYSVRISVDSGGIVAGTCTCPHKRGGWCKHIAATLIFCIRKPEALEERPSIETILSGLDREQLQTLLLRLVEQQPGLADIIESQVPSLHVLPAAGQASIRRGELEPRQRRTPLDPNTFRRQVHAILHSLDRMRRSEAYWHVGDVVSQVRQVLEQACAFVEAGDGRNALVILEAVTEEYMEGWENLDDSDGAASDFLAGLGPLWTEALLTADLSAEERQARLRKLAKWQQELEDYGVEEVFASAQAAAKQGWDYGPLVRVLRGKSGEKVPWEGEPLESADELAVARLNVLERQGRYQEYLYLAEAEGQTERYTTLLAKVGRAQEAVNYGLRSFAVADQALALAKVLREKGNVHAALQIAEHGLRLEGSKATLADWLADLAGGMGDSKRALDAATLAFRESTTLVAYLKVQDLAGERWPALKTELLAHLAGTAHITNKIDIYVHEGMIEEAVQAIDADPYAGYGTLEQVVDSAIQTHPDWVIRRCQAQAERIMDRGKAQHYHHAVNWLGKARAAYRAAGRETEWQKYLNGVIAKHRRKHSLVPMLEALKR